MNRRRLERELREVRVPDERGAAERSWQVVRAAWAERDAIPGGRPARLPARLAVAVTAFGALLLALALTPAGAAVREWVARAVDVDGPPARPALNRLPAPGELLVASRPGVWLVRDDGTRRLLGDFDDATFSPHGLYVAATSGRELFAVSPLGELRWSLTSRRPIADARWAPSGYRVAYRDGPGLDVIAGDGTEPRTLVERVDPVAPSWRPPPAGRDPRYVSNVLSFADAEGAVVTLDADTGEELWRWRGGAGVRSLAWAGHDRLVVATARGVDVLDRSGRRTGSVPLPGQAAVRFAVPSQDGRRLAVVIGSRNAPARGRRSRLILTRLRGGRGQAPRTLFSGLGRFGPPVFPPDGGTILLPWDEADQWLFIRTDPGREPARSTVAIGRISRQFDPQGGGGTAEFATVAGWCCG